MQVRGANGLVRGLRSDRQRVENLEGHETLRQEQTAQAVAEAAVGTETAQAVQ